MVLVKEIVVTTVVALHRRWMRAIGTLDNGIHQKSGNHSAIWVAGNDFRLDNLLRYHDHAFCCTHTFEHDSEIPPAVRVTFRVSALNMNNGDIWIQRAHRPERFFRRKWRKYLIEEMIAFDRVRTQRASCRQERHAHCASLQSESQREVRHVENLQPVLLDSASEVVCGAHHDVANPGGNHFFNISGADKLIEKNVGDRPDQCQPALALANDLVSSSKRDHLLKLQTHCYRGAVGNELGDGVVHRTYFAHRPFHCGARFSMKARMPSCASCVFISSSR